MNALPLRTVALLLALLAVPGTAAALDGDLGENLGEAQKLYAQAAFEEALAVLEDIPLGGAAPEQIVAVHRYRAGCLVALGRAPDAEKAMEAVARLQPELDPVKFDESPRLREAYARVRARVLPDVVRDLFGEARTAYAEKRTDAVQGFQRVLRLLDDPALGGSAAGPLSDIRTLAEGFTDLLGAKAAEAAPPPEPVPAAPARAFYTSEDRDVLPPRVVSQNIPRPPVLVNRSVAFTGTLALEVSIATDGSVENVTVTQPLNPIYDAIIVDAARRWRYDPAVLNGAPVPFRKKLEIVVRDED